MGASGLGVIARVQWRALGFSGRGAGGVHQFELGKGVDYIYELREQIQWNFESPANGKTEGRYGCRELCEQFRLC